MFDRIETLRMARAMTDHAARRQVMVARNVANADTPGFKAQDLEEFGDSYGGAGGPMPMFTSRAGHLPEPFWTPGSARVLTTESGASPDGNTVSLEDQMLKQADVKREHEVALSVYRSGLDILRTSIGRRT